MVYGSSRQSFTANTLLAGQEGTYGQHDTRDKQQQGNSRGPDGVCLRTEKECDKAAGGEGDGDAERPAVKRRLIPSHRGRALTRRHDAQGSGEVV